MEEKKAGIKRDVGKIRAGLVIGGFADALMYVSAVGTYGAEKYTDDGWKYVENGEERYTDAMLRHFMAEMSGELYDNESGMLHAAHAAWNALARLDYILQRLAAIEEGAV